MRVAIVNLTNGGLSGGYFKGGGLPYGRIRDAYCVQKSRIGLKGFA